MFFDLTDEQRQLQETVTAYFASEFPLAAVRHAVDGDDDELERLWGDLTKLGVFGIAVSEDHGGAGLGILDAAVVLEALGAAAAPGPVLEHVTACVAIAASASSEQRDRLLPALVSGELRATVAIGEGRGCWRPQRWSTQAVTGLGGTKTFVVGAGSADVIVVGTAQGWYLLETDAVGVRRAQVASIDPTRTLHTLHLDDAPAERLDLTTGAVQFVYDTALVLCAAQAFGGAMRCVELSADYAKTRTQFGTTIAHFQGVKHQLANLAVDVLPAASMYWYAAHLLDSGDADASRFAALTKAHMCERYVKASREMIELHGGIGYAWECDTNLLAKRALFDLGYLGTPPALREYVAETNGWLS